MNLNSVFGTFWNIYFSNVNIFPFFSNFLGIIIFKLYFCHLGAYLRDYSQVKDKDVLIIGSQNPWIEIIALVNGAKSVTTVEYQKIHCTYPKITTLTTYQFNEKYLKGELPKYDVVISYSSLEHSGM